MALVLIFSAEAFLFSKSYLLVDRANTSIAYKTIHESDFDGKDVVFFGASQVLLGVDTGFIEEALHHRLSIGNYCVAWTGTNLHFYLSLKKYLKHHEKPKLILVSVPARCFGQIEPDGIFINDNDGATSRFRRYFDFDLLWDEPIEGKWKVLGEYYNNLLPSLKYKDFIKDYLIHSLIHPLPGMEGVVEINQDRIERLKKSNGHLGVEHVLPADDTGLKDYIPKYALVYTGNREQDRSIERFVELADREGIPTIFFHTPLIDQRYPSIQEKGWLSYIDARLESYEKQYKHFTYLRIKKIDYESRYFSDWVHLNEEGAEIFTEDLFTYLEPILKKEGLLRE
ncbi:MAG: hypothetical protein ABIK28_22120 [Planctomycetota bacterium]